MREDLQRKIVAALHDQNACTDDLFLDIHRYQHARDPVLRALCPTPATTIDTIPAIPVGLFRDLEVGTLRSTDPHVAFHTSGTTGTASGVHRMKNDELYAMGSILHARAWLPDSRTTLALMPDRATSSLAHMLRLFEPVTGPLRFGMNDDGFVTEALVFDGPTFVCATAFALDGWLAREPAPLPTGSTLMVTGGFKGREHKLNADSLLEAAKRLAPVVVEYGMTELSSQLWANADEPYQPPHWLRVTAVDPVSGSPLPPGSRGQLRFLDLCNLDSTIHIETLDQGVVHPDGTVTLDGRLADAPARGCSLTADDILHS